MPAGTKVLMEQGQRVRKGEILGEADLYFTTEAFKIVADDDGVVLIDDGRFTLEPDHDVETSRKTRNAPVPDMSQMWKIS
jgi:hypothetical protein